MWWGSGGGRTPLAHEQEPPARAWGEGTVKGPAVPLTHDALVSDALVFGWVVLAETPTGTWVARPVNHLLHFLVGLATCGVWWLVWIVLVCRPSRRFIPR